MQWKAIFCALLVAVIIAPLDQASAFGIGGGLSSVKKHLEPRFINGRGVTLAPMGHAVFCHEQPGQCTSFGPAIVKLDKEHEFQLRLVNAKVNLEIRPVNDKAVAPDAMPDTWSLAPRAGDCEDFAVTKRAELIKLGWPSRALRMAVGKTYRGEGHAVLVVRTSQGDMVLDNRTSRVLPWYKAGIIWTKIQSSANAKRWQRI